MDRTETPPGELQVAVAAPNFHSDSTPYREYHGIVQLNLEIPQALRDRLRSSAADAGVPLREVVIRLLEGWIGGKIQLP